MNALFRGTTAHAAQKLGRRWIGIDITYLAINLIKRRLKDVFGEEIEFEEKGQPTDFASAKPLTELDKFQFQHWALSLIDARPLKEGKGADRGVDGLFFYYETERKDLLNRIREDAPVMHGEPIHRARRRFQWTWVVGGAASPTKMMIPSPPGFWPTVSMAKSGFQLLMDQMLPA